MKVIGIWSVAAFVSLCVAANTRLGPVVFVLSERHGVHLGDLLAVATCAAWASDAAGNVRRRARSRAEVPSVRASTAQTDAPARERQ